MRLAFILGAVVVLLTAPLAHADYAKDNAKFDKKWPSPTVLERKLTVYLYEHKKFKGQLFTKNIAEAFKCYNLEYKELVKKVSSYNVIGGCCFFYGKRNCVSIPYLPTLLAADCGRAHRWAIDCMRETSIHRES